MMSIPERLKSVKDRIPENVLLVAVSKTMPESDLIAAYEAGQRVFGENKAQELSRKSENLPNDIQWHFIGHLQTNKVKYIAPSVYMIESVDSLKLLKEINKQAAKFDRKINCLLQFHIAEEDTKFGLDRAEATDLLTDPSFKTLDHIRICGVMGMATFTDSEGQIRREFRFLKAIFDWLQKSYFSNEPGFKQISMGMSGDFPIAIEEGATMVRVGSLIFGERNYRG